MTEPGRNQSTPRPDGFAAVTSEVARTARVMGCFFAWMPLVAYRAAGQDRPSARALVLAHAARARRDAGIDLVIDGAEHVPTCGPFVLVYNEASFVQSLANLEVLARVGIDKAVMAAEYGLIPCFSRAAPVWGVVLLRRGHRDDVERTLASLVADLRAGERVAMAPEGRISPDGGVGHFKRGAFLVAIRAGVPVVPIGVRGGPDILPPGSWRMRRGTITYVVGDPISTARLAEPDAPALAEHVHDQVVALIRRRRRPRVVGRTDVRNGRLQP